MDFALIFFISLLSYFFFLLGGKGNRRDAQVTPKEIVVSFFLSAKILDFE